jgi:hypothetical protein
MPRGTGMRVRAIPPKVKKSPESISYEELQRRMEELRELKKPKQMN